MSSSARRSLLLLLVACVPDAEPKKKHYVARKHVASLIVKVPDGWTAHYNAIADAWRLHTAVTTVVFERTPESSTASPEAMRQALKLDAEIESRAGINGGFVTTLVRKPSGAREVYVIREIYNRDWFRCVAQVPDDVVRDQVIAICKSFKVPKK